MKVNLQQLKQMILAEVENLTEKTTDLAIAHDRPEKVKMKKDSWAGGQNIHHDLDWEAALDLKGPVSTDCKDSIDHKDAADVIHAAHFAWDGAANDTNITRNTDWMKALNISEVFEMDSDDIEKFIESNKQTK